MKINYYYDAQFRRVLKHLIRLFGEFQIANGFDSNGVRKYRKVPARYADISRLAAYMINGNSENVMPTAPMITINVQSLKLSRENIRSPISETIVMGTNKSPAVNEYTKELDKRYEINRFNPTPWELVFNVNIWANNLTNKMEIFEQIVTLFNPSVVLQLSENPLDWTSAIDVELIDCNFSSRSFPQGTDPDLDVLTLSFKCPIWFSLPATVKEAKLIKQIVTNLSTAKDELDLEMGINSDIAVDVYTPKNMAITVNRVSSTNSLEVYNLTLVGSSLNEKSTSGHIYSWDKYLQYLEEDYGSKTLYIKFQQMIEDANPIRGDFISLGSDDSANIMTVQVDTSSYTVNTPINAFISEDTDLNSAIPEQKYINISERNIHYKETVIPPNYIVTITNTGGTLTDPSTISDYVYNSQDTYFYRYSTVFGWHQSVMNKYRPGLWRIAFKDA